LQQLYANGITQDKVKKWLTAHIPQASTDHSNGEFGTTVAQLLSDHLLSLWFHSLELSLNTLFTNMNRLETKKIQFIRLLSATSDMSFGALTSTSK
jgi:hypothetical protein